ncbi:MAG: c-type heme family protein [Thermoanaerobaculia bacterium]
MSLFVKFNLILILCVAIALVPAHLITRSLLERNARTQVVQMARLMMQTALATRGYTNKQIKPLLAPRLAEEFLPQSVPAYSATEIFNTLRETHPEYTYKEATLNPTNPRDRTVDWEADVVNAFRSDTKLREIIGERDAPLGRALYLARPITITDPSCLSCHTTPETTPASLVKKYGPSGGFGWQLNETIGAQIVSVPMALPVNRARKASQAMLATLVGIFGFMLLLLNVMLWFTIIRPIRRLSRMADEVSTGNLDVPEVRVRSRDEVGVLAGSFNRMRISLAKALKMLDGE